jgi:hypothetical protein
MFDSKSRYYECEDASFAFDNGQTVTYKRRRFLPALKTITSLQEITTSSGDRLDNISYKFFGSSEQYWHICDANEPMHPLDLTSEAGKKIKIPVPWS